MVYRDALETRLRGRPIRSVRILSPSLLHTALPPIETIVGQEIQTISLLGKRLVFALTDNLFLVMHLMIAGRLHWKQALPTGRRKIDIIIPFFLGA